jgi:hypothetical protein
MEEFKGTIIDVETIGEFSDCDGLERYKQIKPIVVGFLDCDMIEILYITEESDQDFAGLSQSLKQSYAK